MTFDFRSANKMKSFFEELSYNHDNIRRKHRYYWDEITHYCNYFSVDNLNILEIGCGTGDLIANLKGNLKIGIDFSPKMIEIARRKYPLIEFQVMHAEKIELNQKFDLIILSNLIGYLSDIQLVFHEIKKNCHSQTKIIITYYNHLWEPILKFGEFIGLKKKTPIQNWLTHTDVRNLLYLEGFEVYRESKRMLLPIYFPLFSNLINKYISKLPLIKLLNLNNYSFAKPTESLIHEIDPISNYSVSIIIPARNESGNIENGLLRIPKFGKSQEIIYVEGNSTDDTWDRITKVASKYSETHNIVIAKQDGKGKNDAVKKGFSLATGEILMILDADLTVPPEDLPKFYEAILTSKGDFINGCRLVYPMEKQAMRFLNIIGNKFFSIIFTWLLDQPLKDTLCGTKVMFRSDYLNLEKNRSFFGDFDPFGDYDLLFGAFKLNLKIVELPIRYRERTYGETNISRFKHGMILMRMCIFAARKIKFI